MAHVLLLVVVLVAAAYATTNSTQNGQSTLNISLPTPFTYDFPFKKANASHTLKIGVVGILDNSTFGRSLTATQITADWINNQTDILPDTKILMYPVFFLLVIVPLFDGAML